MKPRLVIGAGFVAALFLAAAVNAQDDRLDQPFYQAGIHAHDIETVVEKLQFEDATTEALFRALYEDFVNRHRAVASMALQQVDEVHQAHSNWRLEHPDEPWPDIGDFGWHEVSSAWLARREAMEAEFERDIEALIGPERAATWRRITQGVRREREFFTLKQHPYSFWVVDLEAILDQLQISTGPLSAELNAWSDEFDRALKRYLDEQALAAETYRRSPPTSYEEMTDQEFDSSIALFDRTESARHAIGQVSQRWMQAIAQALGDADAKRFIDAVQHDGFPAVFKASPVELVIERMDEVSLDGKTASAIRTLVQNQYEPRQRAIRERLIKAHESWSSPKETIERWREYWEGVRAGEIDPSQPTQWDHPALPIWIENRQLSLETCRAIRALIPAEQFEALPFSVRLWLKWWEE